MHNIFIFKAKEIHGNKYDYSLVEYKNAHTKIKIICKEHGIFEQYPRVHINNKAGCKKCADSIRGKQKSNNASIDIINKFIKIHDNKYDYSKFVYKNNFTTAIIICKNHGEFEQTPANHLAGKGCYFCGRINTTNKQLLSYQNFVDKCNIVHNYKYDYSKFIYEGYGKKSIIICSEHGDFLQTPRTHLNGSGCKLCNKTSKGEKIIAEYLSNNNIYFIKEYQFNKCKNKRNLRFDFYIPNYNLCIEYDGIQHYKQCTFYGHKTNLKYIQNNDKIKNEYCHNNNIRLIRIKYNELKNIYIILKNIFN